MKESREHEIKLFGMKIGIESKGCDFVVCLEDDKVGKVVEGEEQEQQEAQKDLVVGKSSNRRNQTPFPTIEPSVNQETISESQEHPKTPSIDEETATQKPPSTESVHGGDTNDSQEKTLKKPDKIIPCPRCNSMDTKFCYYNNYNVNQPRHFCKTCQRYWTSGGATRNVPVGAGRRKNKNSASHCRQITIAEALQGAQISIQSGINGSVLSFGSDARFSESMAINDGATRKGFLKIDRAGLVPSNGGENGDDCSSGSSVTTSNSVVEGGKNGFQEPTARCLNAASPQIPSIPGIPWPYYPMNLGFPMSFYPIPYWNCGAPGSWRNPSLSPTSPQVHQHSPILGKRSREEESVKPTNLEGKEAVNQERSILMPKTLRIDDADEVARSSIWATLGAKNEFKSTGGIFKAFQPKGNEKSHVAEPSPALWANPAAFSRSVSFREGS